ncbi:lig_chan-Glu_bd domain-containing protein [Caerostris extrusa]|uniref:Lig_chan-Glu_bd domain-containing protein n=1 Tax=Caerostris extrusa TaxID=172846 RepID=A0AAV4WD04_CAEEX|nr:lig_chan-Glu_bd domain-containing protein [Caerostris extrusa]
MSFPSRIRVAAREFSTIFSMSQFGNHTFISGIEAKLLNILSEQLNFSYDIMMANDKQWGSTDQHGNWTGVIGMLIRNEADIGLSHMAITEKRTHVVDFSFPYGVLDRTFVTGTPGVFPKMSSFIYPFSTNVWLFLLALMVLAPFLFRALMFKNRSLSSVFIMIFGSMLKQPINNAEQPCMQRFIYGLWVVSMTFMYFAYSGVLLSFLTIPWQKKAIRNIKELANALQAKTHTCLAPEGTIDVELLLNSDLDYYRTIGNIIKRNNWVYDASTMSTDLLDEKTVLIGARNLIHSKFGYEPYMTQYVSEDSFACLYDKWWRDSVFVSSWKLVSKTENKQQDSRLPLEDFYGVFILLIVGYILSFIAFFGEIYIKRKTNLQDESKEILMSNYEPSTNEPSNEPELDHEI